MITLLASPSGTGDGISSPTTIGSVKTLVRSMVSSDDVTVLLSGGTYRLSAALSFTAEDSGQSGHTVKWLAADSTVPPVLSCGTVVTGWTQHQVLDEEAGVSMYRASVPIGSSARQIYVNGVRRGRAWWSANIGAWTAGSYDFGGGINVWDGTYTVTDPFILSLARPLDLELVNDGKMDPWSQQRIRFDSFVGGLFTGDQGTTDWRNSPIGTTARPMGTAFLKFPYTPSFVSNAYEFLTASKAGSFYLDSLSGFLYYIPVLDEDLGSATVILPATRQAIVASGLSGVEFRGISIEHTAWDADGSFMEIQANGYLSGSSYLHPAAAVELTGCSNVTVRSCRMRRLGGGGVYVGAGSSDCIVRSNFISDTSATPIRIGDVDTWAPIVDDRVSAITVEHNVITDTCSEFLGGCAIQVGYVDHVRVLHNTIRDVSYTGISLGWGWDPDGWTDGYSHGNEIAYNDIRRPMKVMRDGAGIYTLGVQGQSDRGSVHDNYIEAVGIDGTANYAAIYPDQGTRYVDFYSNVCVQGQDGNPSLWLHANSGTPGRTANLTATDNYQYQTAGVWASGSPDMTGVSDAISLGSFSPAEWSSTPRAIYEAAGSWTTTTLGDIVVGHVSGGTATISGSRSRYATITVT